MNAKENTGQDLPEKKKGGKRKVLLACLIVVALSLVVCLTIAAYLLYSFFDHEPLEEVIPIPNPRHLNSLMKKFYNTHDSDDSEESNTTMQIMGLLLQQSRTLELSREEVNALLDYSLIAGRPYLAAQLPNLKIADARLKDGTLQAEGSFNTGIPTPFGRHLNFKIRVIPEIKEKNYNAKLEHLSVGRSTVSGKSLQNMINRNLDAFARSQTGKDLLELIQELDVKDDKVSITFSPQQMNMFLLKRLGYASEVITTE